MSPIDTLNLLPCIYLHIKYTTDTNTFTYLSVNNYYAEIFSLKTSYFTNKDVGFLDFSSSDYSDIAILIFCNSLYKKSSFNITISLDTNQNHITKTIKDTISLTLFGKLINSNEYIIVGFKEFNFISNSKLEPTDNRILNNIPIYLYWKDTNDKYLGSNNPLALYLAVDEPIFSSLSIPPSNTLSYFKYCDNLILSTKNSLNNIIETHLIAPEGKRIHLKVNKIPIFVKGLIIAILYTYEDITDYIDKLNTFSDIKELLDLKEQQYQDLLDKTNNNNTDTNINNLFNSLVDKNSNSEKELIQLEILLNKIEEQVKILYEKVYTSDNSIITELSKLKENQEQDLRNFTVNTLHIDEIRSKISSIENSISFILFFKNLTSKQILLFFLVFSFLFTFVGNRINNSFIKQIIEKVEKVI